MRFVALLLPMLLLQTSLAGDTVTGEPPVEGWLEVGPESLEISAGSALDFSALVTSSPAGASGRLTLSDSGALLLGGAPAYRFNCALVTNGPDMTWTMPTHAEADQLATQLRRHGYNLVRFHFMDGRLIQNTDQDHAIDPVALDRYYYLLAALKRNGIYWMLDIVTSYDGDRQQDYGKRSVDNVKARMNFDPGARAEWLSHLERVYAQTNPYTGQSILADPALAFVVGINENSLAFWSQVGRDGMYPTGIPLLFDRWLRSEYSSDSALRQAVPDISEDELAGRTRIAPPASWAERGPRMRAMLALMSELELDTYDWMTGELRGRGFDGPLLANPEWFAQQNNRTRSALPITDIHAYVGEITSLETGQALRTPSMTSEAGLANLLTNSSARWLDRPMVMSEYGMPFPNPYRRESGLMFPAMAAFQGYAAGCRMATIAVEPRMPVAGWDRNGITAYGIGVDPVARVAETLSTLLFYRGDVRPAIGAPVAIPLGDEELSRVGSAILPLQLRRAALLVRFGLLPAEDVASLPEGATVLPLGADRGDRWQRAIARVVDIATGERQAQAEVLAGKLRDSGALPPDNITDPSMGLYQSNTGELLLDEKAKTYSVITPRTEAITGMTALRDVRLGTLSVRSTDKGALVAASALDGKPLAQSGKILLMLVSDARNHGMILSQTGDISTVAGWGRPPVMLQQVQAQVELALATPGRVRLSVLSLNGEALSARRLETRRNGAVRLDLDTGAVEGRPTTFFLLERDPGQGSQ